MNIKCNERQTFNQLLERKKKCKNSITQNFKTNWGEGAIIKQLLTICMHLNAFTGCCGFFRSKNRIRNESLPRDNDIFTERRATKQSCASTQILHVSNYSNIMHITNFGFMITDHTKASCISMKTKLLVTNKIIDCMHANSETATHKKKQFCLR